jgi:kynureninase
MRRIIRDTAWFLRRGSSDIRRSGGHDDHRFVVQSFEPAEDVGAFSIIGNQLVVELSNLANGLVVADAVRIKKINENCVPYFSQQ